jgi:hypothetical protein
VAQPVQGVDPMTSKTQPCANDAREAAGMDPIFPIYVMVALLAAADVALGILWLARQLS